MIFLAAASTGVSVPIGSGPPAWQQLAGLLQEVHFLATDFAFLIAVAVFGTQALQRNYVGAILRPLVGVSIAAMWPYYMSAAKFGALQLAAMCPSPLATIPAIISAHIVEFMIQILATIIAGAIFLPLGVLLGFGIFFIAFVSYLATVIVQIGMQIWVINCQVLWAFSPVFCLALVTNSFSGIGVGFLTESLAVACWPFAWGLIAAVFQWIFGGALSWGSLTTNAFSTGVLDSVAKVVTGIFNLGTTLPLLIGSIFLLIGIPMAPFYLHTLFATGVGPISSWWKGVMESAVAMGMGVGASGLGMAAGRVLAGKQGGGGGGSGGPPSKPPPIQGQVSSPPQNALPAGGGGTPPQMLNAQPIGRGGQGLAALPPGGASGSNSAGLLGPGGGPNGGGNRPMLSGPNGGGTGGKPMLGPGAPQGNGRLALGDGKPSSSSSGSAPGGSSNGATRGPGPAFGQAPVGTGAGADAGQTIDIQPSSSSGSAPGGSPNGATRGPGPAFGQAPVGTSAPAQTAAPGAAPKANANLSMKGGAHPSDAYEAARRKIIYGNQPQEKNE
ncbi:MAG: hypothetical protein PHO89_11470 [Methylacidiphilaceae bacterium]|nr:hypothetical protein [Candidatus Methylacidiphilaceae bacterium]